MIRIQSAQRPRARRNIAVVGSGIAGLSAAYLLSRTDHVEIFEALPRAGGHTNTLDVTTPDGRALAIDTGFIVHNRENYPRLIRLFDELGIVTQPSEMSFAVSSVDHDLEYRGGRLWAQGANLRRPAARRLLAEITRFLATGRRHLDADLAGQTLAEFAARAGYSRALLELYLVPMSAALWSMPPGGARQIPAEFVLRFFDNHSLLGFRRRRWRTVTGGSRRYVSAILRHVSGPIHLATPVQSLRRADGGVELRPAGGPPRRFDAVVVATHGDQALRLLADPDPLERAILGAFRTTPNRATLHTDRRLLPRRRALWSSWNVMLDDSRTTAGATLTYYMNALQRLAERRPYCVTLNRDDLIDPAHVIAQIDYRHPVIDAAAVAAQARIAELDGNRRTYYCGAYQGWGFHEDGIAAACRVAAALGVAW